MPRLALALIWTALAATTATAQPTVETREEGQLVYQGAPPIPAEVRAVMARYQNARAATFEDWLADGSMLVTTRFGETVQVHRVEGPGMARRQLTFEREPVTSALAQPGAQRFVYPRDVGGGEYYQGFLRDLAGAEIQFTEPGTRNAGFTFSSDGRTLYWSRVTRGEGDYDILAMDVADPSSRRVVLEGEGAVEPVDVSPDGRTLLVQRYRSVAESEYFLLDTADGRLTPFGVGKGPIAYAGGEFTPDGRAVILLSDENSEVARPMRIEIGSGVRTYLGPAARWPTEAVDLSPDGRRLAYLINEDGFSRLVVLDLASGRPLPAPELPKGVATGLKFSKDGASLAVSLSSATSAGDVWVLDLAKGELERWTRSELGDLDPARLTEPELIRYESFDGREIPAFVFRPQGARGKLPVVVKIHGGPESQERPAWDYRRQAWIDQLGAAVIIPNVRGSDGYGKTWLSLDNAEKREDSVKDIGALLDWIGAQPDLDADRVAMVGQSYGGYMVLATHGHYSERLAGVIDLYGISDFKTFLENTEGYRRDLRRAEYGDERDPAMRAVFERIAPIRMADRMTKPMMVFQGANDPRVPQSESEQLVADLRARGREVWYVLARDEGHGIQKKSNAEAVRALELMFLAKVLGTGLRDAPAAP